MISAIGSQLNHMNLGFNNIFVSSYFLQITRHPTLGRLLPIRVLWTHHDYGFCNIKWLRLMQSTEEG